GSLWSAEREALAVYLHALTLAPHRESGPLLGRNRQRISSFDPRADRFAGGWPVRGDVVEFHSSLLERAPGIPAGCPCGRSRLLDGGVVIRRGDPVEPGFCGRLPAGRPAGAGGAFRRKIWL